MNELGPKEQDGSGGGGTRPTGHEPVDVQLRQLGRVDTLAVQGHLQVYENVHSGLRDALASLDRSRS